MMNLEHELVNYFFRLFNEQFPIFKKKVKHEENHVHFEISSVNSFMGYKIVKFELFLNGYERLPYSTLVIHEDKIL